MKLTGPFVMGQKVIAPILDDQGNKTGEVEGIFEGYGPMKDECSVLYDERAGELNQFTRRRRLHRLKWADLKPVPKEPESEGVPQ